jgi:hypothetical protein
VQYDKERSAYFMKEKAIGDVISQALALQKGKSKDAKKLEGWRQPVGGKNSGNFGMVVMEVCQKYLANDETITVGEVNAGLDDLAKGEEKKVKVMSKLLDKMSPRQVNKRPGR